MIEGAIEAKNVSRARRRSNAARQDALPQGVSVDSSAAVESKAAWRRYAPWCVVACMLVAIGIPWWPPQTAAVEPDSIRIAYGAAQVVFDDAPHYLYRYDCQPGTYCSVAALTRLSSRMLKPIVAFRLLTIAAFLAVLISSTLVMRALLGYPGWFCVASLLLCQELFVSSYYPNSNMLALACGVMALAVLATGKSWLRACSAGVLYGIGVWMRFDLVLICLVFPVVMNPRSRRDWAQVLSMAVLSVVVSNLLLWASGASLARVLSSYGTHDNAFKDFGQTLRMYGVVFTGLTLVTTSCGLLYYWNTRSWRLLLLCAAAALPSVFAFGISVTTPKYLLYAVTIVTVASATGLWRLIQEGGRTARAGVAVLFAAQYIFNPFWLAPGEGKVATDDGVRRVGAVYANIVDWHQSSRASGDSAQRLNDHLQSYLARELNAVIVVRENSHRSLVPYYLLLGRYTFDRALPCSQGHVLFFSRNNRTAALFVLDAARNDPLTIDELTELDIPIPKRLQLIGYLKPQMISFAKSSRQRGTGKYGTCLVECR